MSILTPKFRASYPKLFSPEVNRLNGKLEYSVTAVFPAKTNFSELEKAMEEACAKKWGPDRKKWPKNLRSPIRANEEREKDGCLPEGYEEGGFFMTLKSPVPIEPERKAKYRPPQVFDMNKQLMLDQSNMYAGCFCQAAINAYAYSQGANSGVTFYLDAVIKVSNGEKIASGRTDPSDLFQSVQIDDSEMGETDSGSIFS
jgi:hypothetical protein